MAGWWRVFSRNLFVLIALGLAALVAAGLDRAEAATNEVGAWRADVRPAEVFPGADRFGPLEGSPAAMAAYQGDRLLGYVFEASDIGYSGKPIKLLAGLSVEGVIVGAQVTEHHEPILLAGIPNERLVEFVGKYVGKNLIETTAATAPRPAVDVVAGATVTAIVIDDSLLRTALKVARSRHLAGFAAAAQDKAELAVLPFERKDFSELLGAGMVRRLSLTMADVDAAFAKDGIGKDLYATPAADDAGFIDLYTALVSPQLIGRNLLGDAEYKALTDWLAPSQPAIVIAGAGHYSWRGSGYVRGGIFDRIQVIQDGMSFRLNDKLYRRLGALEGGSPDLPEIGLFKIPAELGFDPAKPWRLELLVQRQTGPREKAFTSFAIDYALPPAMVKRVAAAPAAPRVEAAAVADSDEAGDRTALWQGIWKARTADIVILLTSLAVLTAIFFFQDALVRRPKLFTRIRFAFLAFTVLWIGGYAGAQLSVVNVFTFTHALMTGFRWDFFLLEPLIFILWCATAGALLLWGRGAYCGWLCPFGALQEILNAVAKKLGVRQFAPKFAWHERAWALKYIIFLALFGLSLYSLALAERWAEIEPFKTVWLLHFARDWQWVLWAVLLLGAGLFVERFYCRYLCPLGGALGIPGRGRMFDWLKRRKQCGFECSKCAKECMVQAIHPNGQINPNECLYCMHCQVVYQDHDRCTPLVMKKLGRGKKAPAADSANP